MMDYFRNSMLNYNSCMSDKLMASKKCCCKLFMRMQECMDVN